MKLIKNIADIFGISESELLEKLSLHENSNRIDILKALGVYSIFETKEELENHINKKISNIKTEQSNRDLENENIIKEYQEQLKILEEKTEFLQNSLNKHQNNEETLLISTLKSIDFVDKIEPKNLDVSQINWENPRESILKQAKANQWQIKEKPVQIENTNNGFNKGSARLLKNGGATFN